jgi:hypothetical protein
MIAILKRYSMALLFLLFIVTLMMLGTWGVKSFGDKMLEETNVQMQPRGEEIN